MIIDILPFLSFATLTIGLVEILLSLFWIKWYFIYGLKVLHRSYELSTNFNSELTNILDIQLLTNSIYLPLKIRRLDEYSFALRETYPSKLLQVAYPSVIRGLISIDQTKNKIILDGMLNYSTIPFTLIFVSVTIWFFDVFLIFIWVFLIIIFYWSYSVQSKRFEDVITKIINHQTT